MGLYNEREVGGVYRKTHKIVKKELNWGAVVFWALIGLMILGAIAN